MATCTLVPGLSCPPGLSACTQTCNVVLLGSVAGLTTVTFPSTVWLVSTWVIVAGWPIFTDAAWFWGTLARATTLEMSITVTRGVPGVAISPAYSGRSAITPEIGLTIRE